MGYGSPYGSRFTFCITVLMQLVTLVVYNLFVLYAIVFWLIVALDAISSHYEKKLESELSEYPDEVGDKAQEETSDVLQEDLEKIRAIVYSWIDPIYYPLLILQIICFIY